MMSEISERAFMTERINEQIHEYKGSSSSSDSESEKSPSHVSWKKRLFGKKPSVHAALGGGKSADVILWRNKQMSGGILAGVTVIWLLFEWIGYHLLTFICHFLILSLAVSFIWSNASSFVNRSPPKFPEVVLPEDIVLCIVRGITYRINEAVATFRYIAFGKDLKKFLQVIGGLWIVSVIGSWFSFWTLFYLVFLMSYTAPVFYEKYEDHVDAYAEKAIVEINKHYAVFDAKVLQKIPRGPFSDKKQN
ncbi:reticulon-like protein B2 isoform X2 [Canna indica]|uniref:Reticulon-like protein n=1 Tax=Canna indica TaxID=4628 RepID=A0AAQ3KDV6_9LILI|nr:reticulon-like protein B2 isoform X2 [Canna indica]